MSYKVFIYAFMLFVSVFAVSGINFTGLFKIKHELEAKVFVMLIILALTYLSSNFIIAFIEM